MDSLEKAIKKLNKKGLVINLFQLKMNKWQANIHKEGNHSYRVGIAKTATDSIKKAMFTTEEVNTRPAKKVKRKKRVRL